MTAPTSVRTEFRTRAVIDWIDVAVTLKRGTQFRYLQEKLLSILGTEMRPYVRPVDPGAGNVATRFVIRLHDEHANALCNLNDIMSSLAQAYPFEQIPEVTGIELALDFYSRHDPDAIPGLVNRLQLSIAANGNPRQFDPDKAPSSKYCNRFLNVDRPEPVTGLKLDPSLNLRIGNVGDAVQWQVYDKRTDNNRQPIEPSQRRARAEITLTGKELAKRVLGTNAGSRLATLDDLKTFRFETLAGLLHFRRFKPIQMMVYTPMVAATFRKLGAWREQGMTNYSLGLLSVYKDKRRQTCLGRVSTRKHSRHTMADADLNDIVRRRFKDLTRRFA